MFFIISLLTISLACLCLHILLQFKNIESELSVSFLVCAARKAERLDKYVYNADLQTKVTYQPQDAKLLPVQ